MEKPTRKPSWKRKLKYLISGPVMPFGLPRRLYSPHHPSGLEAIGRDFDGTGHHRGRKLGQKELLTKYNVVYNKEHAASPKFFTRVKQVSKSILTGKALPSNMYTDR
tara:strand:+ start:211 stop:531 length:321 start_codon:yes stop_codon:yes gene_type:complete